MRTPTSIGNTAMHQRGLVSDWVLAQVEHELETIARNSLDNYTLTGVSIEAHPISHYRDRLRQRGILGSPDVYRCQEGARVQVTGLIVMHQAPQTANGFRFLTLEDCKVYNAPERVPILPSDKLGVFHAQA